MRDADVARLPAARQLANELLPAVSRTFALSIRVLRGELGRAALAAYLLCRIADTLEDEPGRSAEQKAHLLGELDACFEDAHLADAFPNLVTTLAGDDAHVRLTRNTDLVFVLYRELGEGPRGHVRRWVREMIGGMRKFVLLYPSGIRISNIDEYREYCYYVAGTVGYMLTDLWREHSGAITEPRYHLLRENCRAFAEALQTVNILKDVPVDVTQENSIYIPEELLREHGGSHETILSPEHAAATRSAVAALVQLAWHDVEGAQRYLLLLPRRAVSIRLFCALPLAFACATLREITASPNAVPEGRVVKITRGEVKSLVALGFAAVASNRALAGLLKRAARTPVKLPGTG